jgi:hypothetical protein
MFRCLLWGITAVFGPTLLLIADNLCQRQQLLVLHRRNPHPRLKNADRRFWVLACRWLLDWRTSLLIVKPETVLRWHRRGWRTYWLGRSVRHLALSRRFPYLILSCINTAKKSKHFGLISAHTTGKGST